MLDSENVKNSPPETFEALWGIAGPKVNRFLAGRGIIGHEDRKDLLQDTALQLWEGFDAKRGSEKFLANAYRSASAALSAYRQYESRMEAQPALFFEQRASPFADIWGRQVPANQWNLAEECSLAPLEWRDRLESIKADPLLYYLSLGASPLEAARLAGISSHKMRSALNQIPRWYRFWRTETDSSRFRPNLLRRLPEDQPLPLPYFQGLFPQPNIPSRLRRLRGYKPEWIAWFVKLSQRTDAEPITFGLIRRLAGDSPSLTEEGGLTFLLAATRCNVELLEQKFLDTRPGAEQQIISFAEIYQLLRNEDASGQTDLVDKNWKDEIVTFWVRTPNWQELEPW
jgi:DNA-directed RNA polymerase specialized sigma24 family protein